MGLTRWEYRSVRVGEFGSKLDELNELAAEGWEVVPVVLPSDPPYYLLKRERQIAPSTPATLTGLGADEPQVMTYRSSKPDAF